MSACMPGPAARTMRRHPCFDEAAHDRVGRVHLPVAPRCNVRCAYCERRVCAHLTAQHPGWTREVLSPRAALERVRGLLSGNAVPGSCMVGPDNLVVGVAGPGEPLANEETFEALRLVHREFRSLLLCLSSNGLLLAESLPRLIDVGVRAVTVTVSAADPEIGQAIYAWVRHQGVVYRGREGAELLMANQLAGIRSALAAGLALKVNSVLVPGLNEAHLPALARRLGEMGVRLMNVMPLIPGGLMRGRRAPTCDELRRVRAQCEEYVPQFRRCEHCRADVVHLPAGSGQVG
ncbi:MAG: radical SAM protein [Anaerolineae bacterium]|nr:radical SAM protein [Anaerolineae bacterium]